MNITVRVASAQAMAQLKAVQGQINATNGALARGAIAGANYNRSLALAPLVKYGNQIQWVGRQLQYNFTLPILLAGGAAAKFALDNEKAFTRIAKVYGDLSMETRVLKNELNALEGAFVALSNHYGVQQKEVLNIAADWAAAGASGVALARGVEQTLITMVLGEMEAVQATKALISIQAQYRIGTAELADTIGILNIVENQTGASLSDLVVGLSKAAGVSRNAGIDVRHLAAYMAALTPAAGSAATAGNGLKTIISRLMSPTLDATGLLREMGIETDQMSWKSLNAVDRIELLAEAFNDLPQAQKAAVSATLGSRYQLNRFDILLEAVTNDLSYYHKALDATSDRAAYMRQAQKELNTVLESNPQRLKQIWVILQNAMADVIQPLIPVILMAATALKDLFTAFTNLPPEIQKVLTLGLLFLALLGPLIRYIGATMALVGILGVGFHALSRHTLRLTGFLARLVTVPIFLFFQGLFTVIMTVAGAIAGPLVAALAFMSKAFIMGLGKLVVATAATMRLLYAALYGGFVAFAPLITRALAPLRAIWVAAWIGLSAAAVQIWAAMTRAFAAVLFAMRTMLIVFSQAMGVMWTAMTLAWGVILRNAGIAWTIITSATLGAMQAIWRAGLFAMQYTLIAFAAAMGAVWRAMFLAWWAMHVAFTKALPLLWAAMAASMRAVMLGLAVFMSRIWIVILAASRAGLLALLRGIAALVAAGAAALFTPIGLAITAAVAVAIGVAYAFRDELARIWNQVSEATVDAFNALPAGIASAMRAVVEIVYQAAMAVYDLFQYLNPFATHSPSLVQNVTRGMEVIRREFGSISEISGPINRAYADIKRFSDATAEFRKGLDSIARAEDLKNLRLVAPGAVDEFKSLVRDLKELQAIEAQLADTPGMAKMEQAIFDNEQAQKRLRLEMLKMGDAGDLDAIRQKYQDIAGQIEMLSGERAGLRAAGAGSDITGWYDDQIAALEKQQGALEGQSAPLQKLQDELAELERQGEILNLQDSLRFDPIRREADEVAAAIRDVESALRDMASAADEAVRKKTADAAKKAKDSVGPGTQAFLDAAGGDFPLPGGKGQDIGREFPGIKDQSGLIDKFTQDLAKRTSEMFDQFDIFAPVRKKWNQFTNWIDQNITQKIPQWRDKIAGFFGNLGINTDSIQGVFDSIGGIVNKIQGWGEALWRLFGDDIKKIFTDLWDVLKTAFEEIGPELEKFKELWPPLVELWKRISPGLKILAGILGGAFLLALKTIVSIFAYVLKPILEAVIGVLAGLIRIIRGVAEVIVGLFTGDFELLAKGLWDIFGGIDDVIVAIIEGAAKAIWGAVRGLVEGVIDFFLWLWDELIGHSVIPNMWDEVVDYFKDVPKKIWKALGGLARSLWDRSVEAMKAFLDGVKQKWEDIRTWYNGLRDRIKTAVGNAITGLVSTGRDFIRGLGEGIRERWEALKIWFTELDTKIQNALPDPLKMLYNAGKDIIRGLIAGVKAMGEKLGDAADWIASKLGDAFPGSPVKTGPLTVLNHGYAGKQIVKMLADGVVAGTPALVSATDYAMRAANGSLSNARLGMSAIGVQTAVGANVSSVVTAANTRAAAAERFASTQATTGGGGDTHNHFYGDLVFPEIKTGDDAKTFIQNLENIGG
jgi:TP901 family phage tail tape measure protein